MTNTLTKEQFQKILDARFNRNKGKLEWRSIDFSVKAGTTAGLEICAYFGLGDDKVYEKKAIKTSKNDEEASTVKAFVPVVNGKATVYFKVDGAVSLSKNGITNIDGNLYSVNKSETKVVITSSK